MSSYARVYDFSIPAGGTIFLEVPGDYYKIISSTGNIGTRRDGSNLLQPMFAGRGEKGAKFQRLALTDLSGSINTGSVMIASEGAEMVDTTLQLLGSVQVRPEVASGNFKASAAMVANTAEQIFSAAANANGALILSAGFLDSKTGAAANVTLLAKATAPATVIDGEVFANSQAAGANGANFFSSFLLQQAQYVPPNVGLYMISDAATGGSGSRHCRYKML